MERFSCTICHRFSSKSSKVVLRHIGSVHSYEPGFSITCGIKGCARVYTNFRSFQKHLQRKHDGAFSDQRSDSNSGRLSDDDNQEETNLDLSFASNDPNEHEQGVSLKRSAALFLLKTLEVGRVSQVTLQTVIEGVTDLFQAHLGEEFVEPFAGLESAYLQQKYFKEEFNMVVCARSCFYFTK